MIAEQDRVSRYLPKRTLGPNSLDLVAFCFRRAFSYRRPKNDIVTPLKNGGSNLAAWGIAGGTGILPVILMDRQDACRNIYSNCKSTSLLTEGLLFPTENYFIQDRFRLESYSFVVQAISTKVPKGCEYQFRLPSCGLKPGADLRLALTLCQEVSYE
jgi:hypothetical protein